MNTEICCDTRILIALENRRKSVPAQLSILIAPFVEPEEKLTQLGNNCFAGPL